MKNKASFRQLALNYQLKCYGNPITFVICHTIDLETIDSAYYLQGIKNCRDSLIFSLRVCNIGRTEFDRIG